MARTRKPISARRRFDVFKRDSFACQYCGAHPPAALLECDHITPVAEGGGNEIDNLVTACVPCNRGKAAVPLCVVPQSLASKAAEIAERERQLRGWSDVLSAKRQRLDDETWRVLGVIFPGASQVSKADFQSVRRFIERLGLHPTLDAAEIAAARMWRAGPSRFRYFCGVCWNKARGQECEF
jgi:hypothetical protein